MINARQLPIYARALLYVALSLAGLCAPRAAEPSANEPLARLLGKAPAEPLAVIACPDIRRLPQIFNASSLGKAYQDDQYAQGREALLKMLRETLGADVPALWEAAVPQITGPAAFVLTATPGETEGAPQLRATLLLAAIDAPGIDALKAAWPKAAPDSNSPFAALSLEAVIAKDLPEAPAWANETAETPGFLRLRLRPRALHAALKGLDEKTLPGWLRDLKDAADPAVLRATLDVEPDQGLFLDRATLELAEDAEGTFARLLLSLRDPAAPWKTLMGGLPGGQEVALLVQASLPTMGEALPAGLQALERELRGKKWTRLHGDEEDTSDNKRFAFVTDALTGAFGFAGGVTMTGEARIVGAANTAGMKPQAFRPVLIEKLGLLGGDFQTKDRAAHIGEHAPIAAAFEGRGLMPAPVIGLSDGWVWLCSSTASYNELTNAFASGKTMSKDAQPPAVLKAPEPPPGEEPAESPRGHAPAQINLNAVLPVYATPGCSRPTGRRWADGRCRRRCCRGTPRFFNKRFGILLAEVAREGAHGQGRRARARAGLRARAARPCWRSAPRPPSGCRRAAPACCTCRLKLIEELKTPAAPQEGRPGRTVNGERPAKRNRAAPARKVPLRSLLVFIAMLLAFTAGLNLPPGLG
ncbi:MAG: hypothetical protein KIS92_22015 [Planctomycetota bacterium]|nr:hypothetical protein [Planctomycetota bacterium]